MWVKSAAECILPKEINTRSSSDTLSRSGAQGLGFRPGMRQHGHLSFPGGRATLAFVVEKMHKQQRLVIFPS